MLNVALGRGSLELRSALLNTDYLNAQLVRGCRTHALLQCLWPTREAPVSGSAFVVSENQALMLSPSPLAGENRASNAACAWCMYLHRCLWAARHALAGRCHTEAPLAASTRQM